MELHHLLLERALRQKARQNFKDFMMLKWQRYDRKVFLDNWHFDYLCKVLTHTLPHFTPHNELLTRIMLNMPPSYGKTETIARCFIAWALGVDRSRKFIYISYSDDLCRKISLQVRELLKSPFFACVFGSKASFIQDNAQEFILKEGGGLFVTTLKSAITGFHAHSILIDDPIKVSGMNSRLEREAVTQNFKESVMSRLQDNQSSIVILMQRLGDSDLCGYLQDERNFPYEIRKQWRILKLKAINDTEETYQIGNFRYTRAAHEPLFPARHNKEQLENLRLQMGEDEFSTQYLQEPQAREAGYFEKEYFKMIAPYELGEHNVYIFIDSAMSVKESADNRAIVAIGVDSIEEVERYSVLDCFYGIWSEEESVEQAIAMMCRYKSARVYIESDGGGLILHRLLQKAIIQYNQNAKQKASELILNTIECYTPSRKIHKVDKIKAIRSYYNTGHLCFVKGASGLEQIQKELLGFNPSKPFRKDDCIDCIASCIAHNDTRPPAPKPTPLHTLPKRHRQGGSGWRI